MNNFQGLIIRKGLSDKLKCSPNCFKNKMARKYSMCSKEYFISIIKYIKLTSLSIKALRKTKYTHFCIFAKFGTHFIPYKQNIVSKLFREIWRKYVKSNKTYFLGLKITYVNSKHMFMTSKHTFLVSKRGQLFYSEYFVSTEYSKHVLFCIYSVYILYIWNFEL